MAEAQARPTAETPPHPVLLLSFGKYARSYLTPDNSHQVWAKWCINRPRREHFDLFFTHKSMQQHG